MTGCLKVQFLYPLGDARQKFLFGLSGQRKYLKIFWKWRQITVKLAVIFLSKCKLSHWSYFKLIYLINDSCVVFDFWKQCYNMREIWNDRNSCALINPYFFIFSLNNVGFSFIMLELIATRNNYTRPVKMNFNFEIISVL